MKGQIAVALEGVSNFRRFQTEMRDHRSDVRDFISRHEVREEERDRMDKRRARIHFALLGGLITLVVGCAIALFTWVLNGHHTVVDAEHPQARISAPQDAGNPPY